MSKTDTMPKLTTAKRLRGLIGPYLEAERLELDDLQLVGGGGTRVLRVVVDGEGGVTLDRLAETSRRLSRLLDSNIGLQGPYRLEVTSPGLERRLRTARHFEKSVDREVVMKVQTEEGVQSLRGRLSLADGRGCGVVVDGDIHWFRYGDVLSARTVFRWKAAPRPGRGGANS